MKKINILLVSLLVLFSACTQQQQSNTSTNEVKSPKKNVVNVEGRVNLTDQHPVITPLPAIMIATYDEKGNPDVMMAAWGGQCGPKHICFNLSPHKTTDNIRLKKAFTVSFADERTIDQSDYFGIVSANDVPDKVARTGFKTIKSPNVDAPIITDYPLTLECEVIEMIETKAGSLLVIGEIINSSADESILTDGKVDLQKLRPLIFNSTDATYLGIGEVVGKAWGNGNVYVK